MKVPQFMPWVGRDEYEAIASCFDLNWITEGPKAKEFNEKLLELMGAKYGVFAPNGTLALYLGLKAIGVQAGDEVIVPDFTFIGSANAIEMVGAKPVFIDVNRQNFQIDLSKADQLITDKTKAIMPVHIYGTVANMDAVLEFVQKHQLLVIEDAAQAIGVRYKDKHAGTMGDVGCFSFFADKTMTTAEGGFVVTNDEAVYDQLLFLRNQGRRDRGTFVHPEIGYNFRMTDMQCAVGLVQLSKLKKIVARKHEITEMYQDLLKDVESVTFFQPDEGAEWIPFRIGILHDQAHDLMAFMAKKEVEARTFFYPLHQQPCYSYLKESSDYQHSLNDDSFPNAIYGYEAGLCLPTFPSIDDEQVTHVCDVIKEFADA